MWYEGNPCNMHLLNLAEEVKKGVEDAGLVGYRFNTVGVSDAISMGTDGMSYSLQSRYELRPCFQTATLSLRMLFHRLCVQASTH